MWQLQLPSQNSFRMSSPKNCWSLQPMSLTIFEDLLVSSSDNGAWNELIYQDLIVLQMSSHHFSGVFNVLCKLYVGEWKRTEALGIVCIAKHLLQHRLCKLTLSPYLTLQNFCFTGFSSCYAWEKVELLRNVLIKAHSLLMVRINIVEIPKGYYFEHLCLEIIQFL